MTSRSPVKAAASPVKAAASPVKPEEVPWLPRRKRRCTLHGRKRYMELIKERIQELDEKIPATKAQFDDYVVDYKFAALDIKLLKKRKREAMENLAETNSLLKIARKDFNCMKDKADAYRLKYLTMVDDKGLYRDLYNKTLHKIDGVEQPQTLFLKAYIDPVADENTDDDIPDLPEDYYVPSTPDYEVA